MWVRVWVVEICIFVSKMNTTESNRRNKINWSKNKRVNDQNDHEWCDLEAVHAGRVLVSTSIQPLTKVLRRQWMPTGPTSLDTSYSVLPDTNSAALLRSPGANGWFLREEGSGAGQDEEGWGMMHIRCTEDKVPRFGVRVLHGSMGLVFIAGDRRKFYSGDFVQLALDWEAEAVEVYKNGKQGSQGEQNVGTQLTEII